MHFAGLLCSLLLLTRVADGLKEENYEKTNGNSLNTTSTLKSVEIISITDENFYETLMRADSNEEWLLEFFADWCGYCNQFALEYQVIADKLSKSHPNVKFANIDFEQNPELASRFLIRNLPSIFYVKPSDAVVKAYVGPLTANAILKMFSSKNEGEGWESISEVPSFLNPLGLAGSVFSGLGWIGKYIIMLVSELQTYLPMWAIIFLAVVLFASIMFLIVQSALYEEVEEDEKDEVEEVEEDEKDEVEEKDAVEDEKDEEVEKDEKDKKTRKRKSVVKSSQKSTLKPSPKKEKEISSNSSNPKVSSSPKPRRSPRKKQV